MIIGIVKDCSQKNDCPVTGRFFLQDHERILINADRMSGIVAAGILSLEFRNIFDRFIDQFVVIHRCPHCVRLNQNIKCIISISIPVSRGNKDV